jgi:26S proteasome regulatory subunit N11
MLKLATSYTKSLAEEQSLTPEQLKNRHVGKQDPKRHLQDAVERAMGEQVAQSLGMGVLAEVSSVSVWCGRAGWLIFCLQL